jgi:hypothetical protein
MNSMEASRVCSVDTQIDQLCRDVGVCGILRALADHVGAVPRGEDSADSTFLALLAGKLDRVADWATIEGARINALAQGGGA